MKKTWPLFALMLCLFFACKKDEAPEVRTATCSTPTIVDADLYKDAPDDYFEMLNATIDGDCLFLRIRFGGGCDVLDAKLLDSGDIAESLPVQRTLRLSLTDNDFCKALVTENLTFNLSDIRTPTENKILLNLDRWSEQLEYSY